MEVLSSFVKLNCVFILVQSSVQSWALFGSGFVLRSQLAGDTTVSIKRNKSNRFCWSSPGVKTAVWQLINVQFWHGWKGLLQYFSWFLTMFPSPVCTHDKSHTTNTSHSPLPSALHSQPSACHLGLSLVSQTHPWLLIGRHHLLLPSHSIHTTQTSPSSSN